MRARTHAWLVRVASVALLAALAAGCDSTGGVNAPLSASPVATGSADTLPIEIDTRIVPTEDWDEGRLVVVFTLPRTNTATYTVVLSSDQAGARVIGQPLASRVTDVKTLRLRSDDLKGIQRIWVHLKTGTNDPVEAIRDPRPEGTAVPKEFAFAGSFENPPMRDESGGVAFATPVSFTLTLND